MLEPDSATCRPRIRWPLGVGCRQPHRQKLQRHCRSLRRGVTKHDCHIVRRRCAVGSCARLAAVPRSADHESAGTAWMGRFNVAEWDDDDLAATVSEYQPPEDYCACLAVQREVVAIDVDILDPAHAGYANEQADEILGTTPLVRVGLAPKHIRVYRADDDHIRSRKLHPIEIFCGSGMFVGFGWHAKADRPYVWPQESPLTLDADSRAIPAVTRAQIERFTHEVFKVVPRRMVPTRQSRANGGAVHTVGERLRMLGMLHGSWKRAAAIVLSEACEGCFNETLWSVIASAAGHGVAEDVVWDLIERHFNADPNVPAAKVTADISSMIARTRPVPKPAQMTFIPVSVGGQNGRRRSR